jgi:CIC family chloride channel protein
LANRLVFFLLAAVTGGLVGLATLGLIKLVLLVQWLGYGSASEIRFASIAAAQPAWQVVLVPAIGGLLVGLLMQWLPGKRYHGIADVMEACALNSARMPARSGLSAALAASVSLGVGAPLGREGPAVHIGASISAWLAEWLGLDRKQSLALLGCGAAAAVTVSFNAPIAGVIFALEVIVGYYTLRVFAPVVIAAMMAVVVRDSFLSSEPLFALPDYALSSLWELPLFALLGACGAGAVRALIGVVAGSEKLWGSLHIPRWLQPAVAGFIIGLVAVQLPMILSIGIEGTLLALKGQLAATLLVSLLVFKVLTVGLAIGSGFAGGVFSPAVFIGTMLGGSFWLLLSLAGLPVAAQGVYGVVGMAAMASAMLGAPISTVLIVFELTRSYEVTLGVMTAAAFASTFMQFGQHGSFFRWQLGRRNVNLSAGRDISLLMTHRVQHLITQRYTRTHSQCTVGELESTMGMERQQLAMVIDADETFHGSISLSELVSHAIETGLDSPVMAAAQPADFSITAMTNIVTALQSMAEQQADYIPVVDNSVPATPRLLGVVLKNDLLAEHYDVVKRARADEFGIT